MLSFRPMLVAGLAVAIAACADYASDVSSPNFSHISTLEEGHLTVCKVGTDADFSVDVGGVVTAVSLMDGECQTVVDATVISGSPSPPVTVTVTEIVPPVTQLVNIVVDRFNLDGSGVVTTVLTGTNTVTRDVKDDHGYVVTFTNRHTGRMTGGGGQINIDGVRITRGLTVHCDITLSNNLEINWTGGNKWHIDKPLTSAQCIDDPNVNPVPPAAPFDTFIGEGVGRLNNQAGSIVRFTFVDAGEPGSSDMATIRIWAPGADPDMDTPVLEVSGNLDRGNLQAHFDQPHR